MPAISPAHARAFWLLRDEIYTQLDEAEYLAMSFHEYGIDDPEAIGKLVCDLVTVIRVVVGRHAEDAEGRCGFCDASWPCPSVDSIHQSMRDPESEFVKLVSQC
jgi:hypothetical protein